jgi:hypothetical protein
MTLTLRPTSGRLIGRITADLLRRRQLLCNDEVSLSAEFSIEAPDQREENVDNLYPQIHQESTN